MQTYPQRLREQATWRERLRCFFRGHQPAEVPRTPEDLDAWTTFCGRCGKQVTLDTKALDRLADRLFSLEVEREKQMAETIAKRTWECQCGAKGAGFLPDEHLHIDWRAEARRHMGASGDFGSPSRPDDPDSIWFCWCGAAGRGSQFGHFTEECRTSARAEPGSLEDLNARRLSPREVCDFADQLATRLSKKDPPDWQFWKPDAKETGNGH